MSSITVPLPPELHKRLKLHVINASPKTTLKKVVIEALEKYLEESNPVGLPQDDSRDD